MHTAVYILLTVTKKSRLRKRLGYGKDKIYSMVLIGIARRGLGFIPAKSSPLSNRNSKMSEEYGRDDAGRKQPKVTRQPEIRRKQGEGRETGKNTGELEGKSKNNVEYSNDIDGEQDKRPGEFRYTPHISDIQASAGIICDENSFAA